MTSLAEVGQFPGDLAEESGPDAFTCRDFYRRFAAGVTIVTSRDAGGPAGLTATAVVRLSLRPPLMLVCVAAHSRTLAAIRVHRAFAVNLLGDDQHHIARTFAQPAMGQRERFAGVRWRDVLGMPIIDDTLGWGVCFVEDERPYGDHNVLIGRLGTTGGGTGTPLLWHNSNFHQLTSPEPRTGSNDTMQQRQASRERAGTSRGCA